MAAQANKHFSLSMFTCYLICTEIASNEDEASPQMQEEDEDAMSDQEQKTQQQAAQANYNRPQYSADDDEQIPGQYNPDDYKGLGVSSEMQELFTYIGR